MRVPPRRNALLLATGVIVMVTGFVVAFILTENTEHRPQVIGVANSADTTDATSPKPKPEVFSLEQNFRRELAEASTDSAKLDVLEWFAEHPQARSSSDTLRSAMLVEQSVKVRLKAFQTARDLALHEDRNALIAVLKEGVGNPYPEVRRESLRSCRDNPQYELLSDLLEVVERGGHDRSVAIEALAFMDDPEAQEKVLETARSEEVPRADRIQAIVLLSQSDLNEAVSYLQELATGEDHELQQFAIEALGVWQDRKAK